MPRISSKNQVTLPVDALEEAGLRSGDDVLVEVIGEGELRIRRDEGGFERAFGTLTWVYPDDYLERLEREDEAR